MIPIALVNFERISEFLLPAAILLGTLLVGLVLRKIIIGRLMHWADKTKSRIDDVVIAAVRGPFLIWCLMLAIYLAMEFSKLPEEIVTIAGKTLLVLGILSVTLVAANITTRMIKVYSGKIEGALSVSSLTQNITRIVIIGVGVLIILNNLGISITPLLTALGIGGLAVALALQDTLSNLFSGFYISLARQIRVGDFIKLESGDEGYVLDIGWRVTRIKMLPNNVVVIPNNKLAQSIITNYYLPDKELAVLVQVGVHYDSDLRKAEKITIEVAREVMKEVKGGVPEF